MLKKNKHGLYQSSLFLEYDVPYHGISTKLQGDGRKKEGQDSINSALGTSRFFQFAQQVHGNEVAVLEKIQQNPVQNADGIIARSQDAEIFLAIRTGDCVPLLLYEPKNKLMGVAHAGWRGTIKGIAKEAIFLMQKQGAKAENILVCIGPHIGMCHYHIPQDRAALFGEKYPSDMRVLSQINNQWHLDIGYTNLLQLQESGVLYEHIDAPIMCTYCQEDDFYSYRRDTKKTFGEMISVIG